MQEWTVDKIEYDFDNAVTKEATPIVLGRKTTDASESSAQQSTKFMVRYSSSTTKSWEHSAGVELTVGQSFEVTTPIVESFTSTTSFEMTTSTEHVWGEENVESEEIEVESVCVAAAGHKEECKMEAYEEELDVPYTMYLSKPGGYEMTETGIWHGVSTFNINFVSKSV